MRVKVTKCKKSPAPFTAEQAVEKIPENEFIKIIDNLHYLLHNCIVRNTRMKMFPDLKISEYKDKFNT